MSNTATIMDGSTTIVDPAAQPLEPEQVESTFEFIDPKTKQKVHLPEAMKPLIENVIGFSRQQRRQTYENQINDLKDQLKEFDAVKARLEQIETKDLPDNEKLSRELVKYKEIADKATKESNDLMNAFRAEKLNNAIYAEASKHDKIRNVSNAIKLFNVECSPTLTGDGLELHKMANVDGSELELSEAFSTWIAKDSNAYLLNNNLVPGSGSNGSSNNGGQATMKRAQFDALSQPDQMEVINKNIQIVD